MNRKSLLFAVTLGLVLSGASAFAQTDMTTVISTVSGYWSSVLTIGIGILLFVVGRRVVKKIG
jgi:hypothetical protein